MYSMVTVIYTAGIDAAGTDMKSKLIVRLNEGKRFASTLGVVTSQVRIDVSNK